MSKVIEIVVIGAVGSGKSHVLELIDKALREGYGPHVQVVSRDLSLERGLRSPGAEPSVETIFHLKERQSGAEPIVTQLKVHVDTSDIGASLGKIDALQGFTIDPLESAIDQVVRLLRDERESEAGHNGIKAVACQRLESHLNELLALQLKQLSEPVRIECSQVGDVSFTELSSGRR